MKEIADGLPDLHGESKIVDMRVLQKPMLAQPFRHPGLIPERIMAGDEIEGIEETQDGGYLASFSNHQTSNWRLSWCLRESHRRFPPKWAAPGGRSVFHFCSTNLRRCGMERERLRKLWEEAMDEGVWYAPWSKAIDGLTAAQAAWKPAEGRHSIWQLVNHIVFWQDYTLRAARGQKPTREEFAKETERRNWEEPAQVSEAAWKDAREKFLASYRAMVDLVGSPEATERPLYHLLHESYHFGQIMYLRALQGLAPIE